MTEDTVVVVGEEKISTWNMPGGDSAFHTSINNVVHFAILGDPQSTSILEYPQSPSILDEPTYMSISPDLSSVVVTRKPRISWGFGSLDVYDAPTGRRLASIRTLSMKSLFTEEGHEVWTDCCRYFLEQSKIIEDSKSGIIEPNIQPEGSSRVIFQESPHGHKVTDGGWVLSPGGKRLLWLPHHWRSQEDRKWGGRFLGLLHRDLPEVVILEFFE